jgi:AmpD protein
MKLAADGWVDRVRRVPSPNRDARPGGAAVSLLLLHAISLPPGEYGGDAIERLFTNRLDPAAHPYFAAIAGLEVSSHLLLRRDGGLLQFVPVHERAWHAGASVWRGRGRCNDFSVGVELEGSEDGPFEDAQYERLCELIHALRARLPLRDVAAHSDVAPGRKTDPGPHFDWARLLADLAASQQV